MGNSKSLHVSSAKQIMEEMGFNKSGTASTQTAFIRYLMKSVANRNTQSSQVDLEPKTLLQTQPANVSSFEAFKNRKQEQQKQSENTQLELEFYKKAS